MAGGVDVNIGADTREFDRGVRSGMIEPVEDAEKALQDYVDQAQRGGTTLERTFTDQQRATEDLRQDIDQLNRSIRDGSGPAYRSAGQESERFTKRTQEGFDEIKDSAKSNAIEVGASFTGGFDQAVGGLQGFVAEFLAGFGPAGLIAGVGAAALLGTVTAAIQGGQEAAEQQKQAVADLANEYLEAGSSGRRTFDSITESIKSMATSDGSDVIITLQDAFDKAKRAGADYQDVVQSIASGSPREIQRSIDAVNRLESAHVKVSDAARAAARAGAPPENLPQLRANQALRDALEKAEKQATEAGRAERLAAKAGVSDLQLKNDLLSQLQDGYDDVAGDVDNYLNKEKSILKVGPYIEAVDKRRDALIKYKQQLAETDLSPAAKKFIESQGAEAAAAMLAGYQKASPRQQAQLDEIWSTAGDKNAASYDAALGKRIRSIDVPEVKIPTPVVPAPDTSALDRFVQSPYVKRVVVDVYSRNGQRIG